MKLTSDAGSTKTTWLITDTDGKTIDTITTGGINPSTMTPDEIDDVITNQLRPMLSHYSIDIIEYYGAGVIGDIQREIISHALAQLNATSISVESDMLGAARALLGNRPGIACILGTGSNTCLYDGKNIVDNVPALGFILGDEGSGASLGRRFVGDIFKRLMPTEVMDAWRQNVGLDAASIIDRVYRQNSPNAFLGSLAPLIHDLLHVPTVAAMVDDEFDRFFTRNIERYNSPIRRLGAVGSIAWHFRTQLERAASRHSCEIATIRRSPLS